MIVDLDHAGIGDRPIGMIPSRCDIPSRLVVWILLLEFPKQRLQTLDVFPRHRIANDNETASLPMCELVIG